MSHPERPDQQPPPIGPSGHGAHPAHQVPPLSGGQAPAAQAQSQGYAHAPQAWGNAPHAGSPAPYGGHAPYGGAAPAPHHGPMSGAYGQGHQAWGAYGPQAGHPGANPYAQPTPTYELASPWLRLAGAVVDGLVYSAAMIPFLFMMLATTSTAGDPEEAQLMFLGMGVLGVLAIAILNAYLVATRSQSIGKILVGTRILKTDGTPCGLVHGVIIRSFGFGLIASIPVIGPLIQLANCFFVFSEDHRMLHDRLASTVVVKV